MVSEPGFPMNVDWYQEATLGPQSLLKTLAGCQGSSGELQRPALGEAGWQLVSSWGVTWRPGGSNIFQNAPANSPMMGDCTDHRCVLPGPQPGNLPPSLQRHGRTASPWRSRGHCPSLRHLSAQGGPEFSPRRNGRVEAA